MPRCSAIIVRNTSARGSYLYDAAGRAYLDFHTGEGFASLGHNNRDVGDVLRARGEPPAPDVEGFGETVEERPTAADGEVDVRGRTVRER